MVGETKNTDPVEDLLNKICQEDLQENLFGRFNMIKDLEKKGEQSWLL